MKKRRSLRWSVQFAVVAVVVLSQASVFAGHFSIGANFTGSSHSQSGFIPPDTKGTVGANHVVEIINGRFAVYNKSGVQQQAKSLNQFWADAGAAHSGSFAFDPRILYDAANSRYYAAAVDNAGGANNFLVAVSDIG